MLRTAGGARKPGFGLGEDVYIWLSLPIGLKRYYGGQNLHFITCSCYERRPWLGTPARRTLFLNILEQVRVAYDFTVIGYVVMPEHIYLLLSFTNGRVGHPSESPSVRILRCQGLSITE